MYLSDFWYIASEKISGGGGGKKVQNVIQGFSKVSNLKNNLEKKVKTKMTEKQKDFQWKNSMKID